MPISANVSETIKPDGQNMRTLALDLGARSYDICIGAGLIGDVAALAPRDLAGRRLFVLTDEHVADIAAQAVCESLKGTDAHSVEMLALPAGEATKSMAQFEAVAGWMLDHGVDRHSILFAVGGGVIGDLGGFAAASIMRGIDFVQMPTSLLAQVDSSVGGKTGINMPQGKNLVGAFHQPIRVICDLDVLKSLPSRESRAGYAEIVKYALINDYAFFEWLEKHGDDVCAADTECCAYAVETSCRKKAEIVAADEREKGQRALLNFGHTFGHAIEAAAGYDGRVLHGEAVAIGMMMAFRLSHKMDLCSAGDVARVEAHLKAVGLPTEIRDIAPRIDDSAADLVEHMQKDKKVDKGVSHFILTRGIGQAFVTSDVDIEDVEGVISSSL